MKKLILLSLVVVILLTAFAPIAATLNRDVTVYDNFSGRWIALPAGQVVEIDDARQGGSQTWYHVCAYPVFWMIKAADFWLPASVLDW